MIIIIANDYYRISRLCIRAYNKAPLVTRIRRGAIYAVAIDIQYVLS